jgi:hypothetical protein
MLYVTSEGINNCIFPVKHAGFICVTSLLIPNILKTKILKNVITKNHKKNTDAFSIVAVNMEINNILIHMINGA